MAPWISCVYHQRSFPSILMSRAAIRARIEGGPGGGSPIRLLTPATWSRSASSRRSVERISGDRSPEAFDSARSLVFRAADHFSTSSRMRDWSSSLSILPKDSAIDSVYSFSSRTFWGAKSDSSAFRLRSCAVRQLTTWASKFTINLPMIYELGGRAEAILILACNGLLSSASAGNQSGAMPAGKASGMSILAGNASKKEKTSEVHKSRIYFHRSTSDSPPTQD